MPDLSSSCAATDTVSVWWPIDAATYCGARNSCNSANYTLRTENILRRGVSVSPPGVSILRREQSSPRGPANYSPQRDGVSECERERGEKLRARSGHRGGLFPRYVEMFAARYHLPGRLSCRPVMMLSHKRNQTRCSRKAVNYRRGMKYA